jgi:sulfite reductase beta subunit-like hemoprotein
MPQQLRPKMGSVTMTASRTERPNIARAKRAGLDFDLAALCAAGPGALEPDDHYRLKTYGVCAQRHADLFMMRMRVAGGRLDPEQLAAAVKVAWRYADGRVHLTTRQNLELHSVELRNAAKAYAELEAVGLAGRSACGHTIRNVMACSESTTSVEEPFDVVPDAQRLSRMLVARSSELNVSLPSRINIVLGGCSTCGQDALTNDIGLVARVQDGVAGYQLWAGGSLGSAPRLSFVLRPFLPREQVWPAVWTIVEWFCREGSLDHIARGRLKFLIEERGEAAFRQAFTRRFPQLLDDEQPPLDPVEIFDPVELERCLGLAPPTGWSAGVRPERRPGLATITVRVPLGDLDAGHLDALGRLAPSGVLFLSRGQNVVVRSVPVDEVPEVLDGLARIGLSPNDGHRGADIRACPGLSFCSLAITGSQDIATQLEVALASRLDLARHVSIAVSACPNSCVKHQAADIGLVGTKFRLDGRTEVGYQVLLGADLSQAAVGEAVLKVRDNEVTATVIAALETWASMRRANEPIAATFRRIGLDRVGESIARRLRPCPDRLVGAEDPTSA